ncbi:MAG: potassium/proton antiporter [Schaedlerella sp.]|nr:potassium/proton antiporter [Schaedlerella sp.]
MIQYIFGIACVILLCILAEKFSDKLGMPALILFMFVGILFGSDGVFKIDFSDFKMAENLCSFALIFIMFYGGFNTKWKQAKKVAVKAVLLSTVGVLITAAITALLCHYVLRMTVGESFLIGAVLSSTDAASVFAILRKKKLNLKDGTASLLEVESGSNDPVSYLLTIVAISVVNTGGLGNVISTILMQLIVGVVVGILIAELSVRILTRTNLVTEGLDTIFIIAMVMVCYAVTSCLNGNAYLSIYLYGIYIGNKRIQNKQTIIGFFDALTSLAQIGIFFVIGLLSFPNELPEFIPTALAVVAFLTVIARPVAVFLLLIPLKCSIPQCLLVSWAGLRGASSSVFAIMAVSAGISMQKDLFQIVFMVSLFSAAIQGTLLPDVAEKLKMIDDKSDVRKTFNDYQDETDFQLMKMHIPSGHNWENKKIKEVSMPTGSLALMIMRDKQKIVTRGDVEIHAGDDIILSVPPYNSKEKLKERQIGKSHAWCDKTIEEIEIPEHKIIAMVLRDEETIIPDGKTVIKENDIVVLFQ